ncbi:hypothetical protein GFS60_06551 (plasmid) [Rhodococcus sp. WAY2]|nr:hypothetical protein GFS60_06551 [Rhodococcus sp. WAY2]
MNRVVASAVGAQFGWWQLPAIKRANVLPACRRAARNAD